MVRVLSVGGSIVVPQQPDEAFLRNFASHIRRWLNVSAVAALLGFINKHIRISPVVHLQMMRLIGSALWRHGSMRSF